MIDSVEPLSCVLWAVAFFAAGMYPLGFMMGAPCSPCCDPQCGDEPIEFIRCIRFVNTDTDAPPTTYAAGETVSQPLHGFSRAVTRPEQIGAKRVGTKADFTARIVLLESASAMSDGETQSATYRYRYLSPTGADLGTAKQWNVTLVGVTRPLTMPSVVSTLQYQVGTGSFNANPAREYSVGLLADSTSAAVSATVHSVAVVSGAQFLDGNTATDQVLKAMLTATIPLRNGTTWVTRLAFAATNAQFQHVPTGTSITLEYVIKHSRGTQHRYRTFAMTVLKFGSPVAIPAGGLSPLSLSQPAAIDTPYTATLATYSNDDPDAVSIYSSDVAGEKVLNTIEVVPVAEQMRRTVSLTANNSQHLLPSNVSFGYAFTEYGYIMRPFDPGGGYAFDSNNHPANSPWNYNVEEVESFLSGGYTLPYNSGTSLVTHNNTWTMEVTEPTQFCGVPLCSQNIQSDVIAKSVRCTPGSLPATITRAVGTFNNPCHGQGSPAQFAMPLSTVSCSYFGARDTCRTVGSIARKYNDDTVDTLPYLIVTEFAAGTFGTSLIGLNRTIPLRSFYCGDLLWVIENGPCRATLTQPKLQQHGAELYELDQDSETGLILSGCASGIAPSDTCYQPEITFNLSNMQNTVIEGFATPVGNHSGGDFVLNALWEHCNSIRYIHTSQSATILVRGVRANWCDAMTVGFIIVSFTAGQQQGVGPVDIKYYLSALNPFGNQAPGTLIGRNFSVLSVVREFTGSYSIIGFGADNAPASGPVITPPTSTVPANGGTVALTKCCPQELQNVSVVAAVQRYARTFSVNKQHAVAYITQEGQGNTYCPFTVEWLSGSSPTNAAGFQNGRIFLNERCPIKGQVNHAEQPSCEWSVGTSAAWLVAEEMPEEPELEEGEEDAEPAGDQVGLLKVSINTEEPAVFAGSFANTGKQFRSATITITSGTAVNTWTIIQLQP